jgi:ABC-type transport system involved in cytochrome c biogenesis permease component
MDIMNEVMRLLPLLIPVFLIQVTLMVVALVDVLKKRNARGNFWVWVVIIVFVNILGPIAYFAFGRVEE